MTYFLLLWPNIFVIAEFEVLKDDKEIQVTITII